MRTIHFYMSLVCMLMLLVGCKAPEDIVYMQDVQSDQQVEVAALQMIKIRPGDQISIIVSSRNPELSNIFNLAVPYRYVGSASFSISGASSQTAFFTVDGQGCIDYPILGNLAIAGLTRHEISQLIKTKILEGDYIKDPVVTVDYANLAFSVIGEVGNPGKYSISKDRITILEAISMARDLTINGKREDVLVMRENADGSTHTYRVNLCDGASLLQSPVYYLQQNDVVYVSPNTLRRRQSTASGNTVFTPTFWISLTSCLCSVAMLINTLSK